MPRLDLPAIVAALGDHGPTAATPRSEDRLGAIIAEVLGIDAEAARSRLSASLNAAGLLDENALAEASPSELIEAVRPRGEVAKKRLGVLRRFARWLSDRGGLDALGEIPTSTIRDELAQIPGLGPGSADSILLFGLGRAAFPVDRSTYRVFVRHGWLDSSTPIDEARDLILDAAGGEPGLLERLSIGLDRIGKSACRPSVALCESCPISAWLPEGGPLGEEG